MIKLKEIRENKGLSQLQVANDLDIHPMTYNGYENGKHEPNLKNLVKIASYFGVSVDFLLNYKKNSNNINLALLTKKQQNLISLIVKSDDLTCDRIEAFLTGYTDGREQQLNQLLNLKNKK